MKNDGLETCDLERLAKALWTVVLSTSHDLEVQVRDMHRAAWRPTSHTRVGSGSGQVRCAGTLTLVLKQGKRDMKLLLPWRPMYELLQNLVADPAPRIDGAEGRRAVKY